MYWRHRGLFVALALASCLALVWTVSRPEGLRLSPPDVAAAQPPATTARPAAPTAQPAAQAAQPAQPRNQGPPQVGFPGLLEGLQATPGVLGIESARTASGKNVLFVWFENKKAALDWYHSDVHQGFIKKFFPGGAEREPMKGVADDIGPIMAIASITPSQSGGVTGTQLPISQIAIELYAPVTGGLAVGGRFAPEKLEVPGLNDYGQPGSDQRRPN